MKDPRFSRTLTISTAIHAGILFLFIVIPFFMRLIKPPKKEVVTIIELMQAIPELPQPSDIPPPEEPEQPPEEQPEQPDKTEIPDPIKKTEEKKPKLVDKTQIKVNTNKIKRVASPPPKKQPNLTKEEIRKLLASGLPTSSSASVGEPSEMAWYYALVRATMYEAWEQPSGAAGMIGLVSQVSITVRRDGSIASRRMIRGSGNATMDSSVMKAVNAVYKLKPLPSDFSGSSKDITIDFELTGTSR